MKRALAPGATGVRAALLVASATLVLALALWLRSLDHRAAIGAAIVAAAAGVLSAATRRWRTSVAYVAVAASCAAVVVVNARERRAFDLEGATSVELHARTASERLGLLVERTQSELAEAAAAAADGAPAAEAAARLPAGSGVVVYVDDRPIDWAGTHAIRTSGLWERAGVVSTPFDVVTYAVAVRDTRRAVVTSVAASSPPAGRLRPSIARGAGSREGVTFDVWQFVDGAGARGAHAIAAVGGTNIAITARPPSVAAQEVAAAERERARGALVLAFAAVTVLVTMWRHGSRLWERIAVIAIPAMAIAITPVNSLSNVTRLFDAATYYAPIGGPFTSSVGSLGISSALALFAVLAVLRSRVQPRQRIAAAFVVLVVAGATPFVLRDLARGVTLPPRGAGTGLWLAWEVALFLAATTLVTAGVWAGQRALGRARGLPLWVAPVIGGFAALLGPVLLGDSARWPAWYPLAWVAAVAALALARRSKAILFPSAFVAACGATTLLWGMTLRERVELATADVQSLGTVDAGVTALLERFGAELELRGPPRSTSELLARYAGADIAVVGAPVVLANWPLRGGPVVLSLGGSARFDEVAPLVVNARRQQTTLVTRLSPAPAAASVLLVPHETGDVTTVVIGARTQLAPAPLFAELLGLDAPPSQPPYLLTLTGPAAPADPDYSPWVRRGSHLHADWVLPTGAGDRMRLHASVPFDAYDALLPRGTLVILLDVLIVAVLWTVFLLADGVLVRWIRIRRREWIGSYRLRLGLALFAFFVVPALAFAFWSYRRLQADDRAARELVVRETLRRAVADNSGPVPTVANVPPDVPLFVYRAGQLVSTSDSLMLALSPIGHLLDTRVRDALAAREELIATVPMRIGARDILFGFRSLTPGLVAGVPARSDDAAIDKRRSDLGVLVVLATVLGAFAALGLSGFAARQLARPIGTLRGGALAVAGGSRAPLNVAKVPSEFAPVFQAFDRMAQDLAASEAQLTRAERVFAWGEMARQVAHEIKNPLTPIRLGVQHLLRAWRDKRPDFGSILETNAQRLLDEIDHLDSTARSFSQFGTPGTGPELMDSVDASAVVRDVVALEAIGADGLEWRALSTDRPRWVRSRRDELREVLLNLCENSRLAGARRVELSMEDSGEHVGIVVRDDGAGIAKDHVARVFEPHFSTRTSGSGLGLAISRRLVEGWGGGIDLESEPGAGTVVRIRLVRAAPPPGPHRSPHSRGALAE